MKALESALLEKVRDARTVRQRGRVLSVEGLVITAAGVQASIGEQVIVHPGRGGEPLLAEVIGLREDKILLLPHGRLDGVSTESEVETCARRVSVLAGDAFLGRVVDGLGRPLDGAPLPKDGLEEVPLLGGALNPMSRAPIDTPVLTGVKAIDAFLPLGRGQRIGLFAGSGVGKSTLLGMMVRGTDADVTIVAMIGERGREVADFVASNLHGRRQERCVVIAASSDMPAIQRRQAAFTATALAEWFSRQGKSVLLVMDSITRLVHAQREIGLAAGEPVGARGFPASSFALLAPLVERAGHFTGRGAITAIYTVLVDADDVNEPVADHLRSILDGHVVLSRELAEKGHYPPIDVLRSISRLAPRLLSPAAYADAARLRALLATYEENRDFVELGAYKKGSSPRIDEAVGAKSHIDSFLVQDSEVTVSEPQLAAAMKRLVLELGGAK